MENENRAKENKLLKRKHKINEGDVCTAEKKCEEKTI